MHDTCPRILFAPFVKTTESPLFSIITTDPNELLEPFHNRCPLIIEPKDYARWLEPAESSHLPIDLVRTWPAEEMKAWRVAKLQGNGPHLLEPVADPQPTLLDGL